MKFKIITIFSLLKEAFQEWQQDKAPLLAAALAYYTVFSITPLLVIAIAIVGAVFGREAARGEILLQVNELVGEQGAQAIEMALSSVSQPKISGLASIISVVVLLVGASGVFAQLQEALNIIWNVKPQKSAGIWGFIRKRLLSFGMVLVIGFLLLISLVLSAVLSGMSSVDLSSFAFINLEMLDQFTAILKALNLLNNLISFGFITVLFAVIYKYLPDVDIRWKDVWIGAIVTTFLFGFGKYLIGLYLSRGSLGSAYGAAGSLIVFLAWVFYSAQIILFGAELTQVYARRRGRSINSAE